MKVIIASFMLILFTVVAGSAQTIWNIAGGNQTICQGSSITLGVSSKNLFTQIYDAYVAGSLTRDQVANLPSGIFSRFSSDQIAALTMTQTDIILDGNHYSWSPSTGLSSSTVSQPVASPSVTTTYTLTEFIPIIGSTITNTIVVTVGNPASIGVGPSQTICNGNSVIIGEDNIAGNTYSWNPSDGLSSTTISNPTASPTTSTTYTLTENSAASGCSGTSFVVVKVNPHPEAITGGDRSICFGRSTTLGNTSILGHTYLWNPSTGLSNPHIANPTASPTETTTYTLTETITATGCSVANPVVVTVNPLPGDNAGADQTICRGNSAGIGDLSTAGNTYSWIPSSGLDNSAASNPTASPNISTTYSLTETIIATGCSVRNMVIVTVNPVPSALAGINLTICSGKSVNLGATTITGHSYNWSPSIGLSSSTVSHPVASPILTTTYVLTEIITATGCSASHSVVITANPLPEDNAGPDHGICDGTGIILGTTATAGHVYRWSPTTGLSSFTVSNPTVAPTATTTYTLTETIISTNCSSANTVVVEFSNIAGGNKNICRGTSTTLGLTSDDLQNYTSSQLSNYYQNVYAWSPSTGLNSSTASNPVASPYNTTTYTVVVTNPVTGCTLSNSIVVTVNTVPEANTGTDLTICAGANTMNIGTTGITGHTYNWVPTTGLNDPAIANPVVSPTENTTYTLTEVITATGCSKTNSVTVTISSSAGPEVTAGSDISICNGSSTPIGGNPTAPADDGSFSYSWWPTDGLDNPYAANPNAFPGITSIYSVTVTDGNGCMNTSSITVTVGLLTTVSAGADVTICNGSAVTIGDAPTAPGDDGSFTYLWSPTDGLDDPNTANPNASPAITTAYAVTVTDGVGCSASATVNVNVSTLTTASAGTDISICNGATVAIGDAPTAPGDDGSFSYSWSPTDGLDNPGTANPNASPASTTAYSVTVNDANGCSAASNTITVTVGLLTTVSAGADVTICNGSAVTIGDAPTAPGDDGSFTYLWSPTDGLDDPNTANPNASPAITTAYAVTVTDGVGCSASATVNVNVSTLTTASAGTDISICNGATVAIGDAPTAPGDDGSFSYSWSPTDGLDNPGTANPNASPASTTAYSVTVNDANGCSAASNTITVTVGLLTTVSAGADVTICNGSAVTIGDAPTAPGDDGSFTYLWSPTDGLDDPNTANPNASPAITTAYAVTVTDGVGCSASATVNVNVSTLTTASAGTDISICNGATVAIGDAPTAPGDDGSFSYSWSPTDGLDNPGTANPNASPASTTAYSVTVNDANGCSAASNTITVTVGLLTTVSAGADVTICNGSAVTIGDAPTAPGDDGSFTYLWSPTDGLDDPNTANPNASPAITTAYAVTVTDGVGCSASATVNVNVSTLTTASAGTDISICNGATVAIGDAPTAPGDDGSFSYSWSPTDGLDNPGTANPNASPASTTAYSVTVNDANGCSAASNTITVTVGLLTTVSAGADVTICNGSAVTIGDAPTAPGDDGSFTYLWSPTDGLDDPNTANPNASPAITTAYAVTVTDGVGCSASATVNVNVSTLTTASAGTDISICNGATVAIGDAPTAPGDDGSFSYSWSPTDGLDNPGTANPNASPASTTAYSVTVNDANGCSAASNTITVTVGLLTTVSAGADVTICNGSAVTIGDAPTAPGDDGSFTYLWSPTDGLDDPNTANPNASPAITTAYAVTVTDGVGCSASATVNVNVSTLTTASAGTDISICNGATVAIGDAPTAPGDDGSFSYSWSPTDGLDNPGTANPNASPASTTAYSVTVNDANGCSAASNTITVTVDPLIIVNAADKTIFCPKQSFNLGGSPTAQGGDGTYTYLWSPSDGLSDPTSANPLFISGQSNTYSVTVTDNSGCTASTSKYILQFPSAFSGLNEYAILAGGSVTADGSNYAHGEIGAAVAVNNDIAASNGIFVNNSQYQAPIDVLDNFITDIGNLGYNTMPANLDGQDLKGGGIYKVSGNAELAGTMTLEGDECSYYIICADGTLHFADHSNVILSGVPWDHVIYYGHGITADGTIDLKGMMVSSGDITVNNILCPNGFFADGNITINGTVSCISASDQTAPFVSLAVTRSDASASPNGNNLNNNDIWTCFKPDYLNMNFAYSKLQAGSSITINYANLAPAVTFDYSTMTGFTYQDNGDNTITLTKATTAYYGDFNIIARFNNCATCNLTTTDCTFPSCVDALKIFSITWKTPNGTTQYPIKTDVTPSLNNYYDGIGNFSVTLRPSDVSFTTNLAQDIYPNSSVPGDILNDAAVKPFYNVNEVGHRYYAIKAGGQGAADFFTLEIQREGDIDITGIEVYNPNTHSYFTPLTSNWNWAAPTPYSISLIFDAPTLNAIYNTIHGGISNHPYLEGGNLPEFIVLRETFKVNYATDGCDGSFIPTKYILNKFCNENAQAQPCCTSTGQLSIKCVQPPITFSTTMSYANTLEMCSTGTSLTKLTITIKNTTLEDHNSEAINSGKANITNVTIPFNFTYFKFADLKVNGTSIGYLSGTNNINYYVGNSSGGGPFTSFTISSGACGSTLYPSQILNIEIDGIAFQDVLPAALPDAGPGINNAYSIFGNFDPDMYLVNYTNNCSTPMGEKFPVNSPNPFTVQSVSGYAPPDVFDISTDNGDNPTLSFAISATDLNPLEFPFNNNPFTSIVNCPGTPVYYATIDMPDVLSIPLETIAISDGHGHTDNIPVSYTVDDHIKHYIINYGAWESIYNNPNVVISFPAKLTCDGGSGTPVTITGSYFVKCDCGNTAFNRFLGSGQINLLGHCSGLCLGSLVSNKHIIFNRETFGWKSKDDFDPAHPLNNVITMDYALAHTDEIKLDRVYNHDQIKLATADNDGEFNLSNVTIPSDFKDFSFELGYNWQAVSAIPTLNTDIQFQVFQDNCDATFTFTAINGSGAPPILTGGRTVPAAFKILLPASSATITAATTDLLGGPGFDINFIIPNDAFIYTNDGQITDITFKEAIVGGNAAYKVSFNTDLQVVDNSTSTFDDVTDLGAFQMPGGVYTTAFLRGRFNCFAGNATSHSCDPDGEQMNFLKIESHIIKHTSTSNGYNFSLSKGSGIDGRFLDAANSGINGVNFEHDYNGWVNACTRRFTASCYLKGGYSTEKDFKYEYRPYYLWTDDIKFVVPDGFTYSGGNFMYITSGITPSTSTDIKGIGDNITLLPNDPGDLPGTINLDGSKQLYLDKTSFLQQQILFLNFNVNCFPSPTVDIKTDLVGNEAYTLAFDNATRNCLHSSFKTVEPKQDGLATDGGVNSQQVSLYLDGYSASASDVSCDDAHTQAINLSNDYFIMDLSRGPSLQDGSGIKNVWIVMKNPNTNLIITGFEKIMLPGQTIYYTPYLNLQGNLSGHVPLYVYPGLNGSCQGLSGSCITFYYGYSCDDVNFFHLTQEGLNFPNDPTAPPTSAYTCQLSTYNVKLTVPQPSFNLTVTEGFTNPGGGACSPLEYDVKINNATSGTTIGTSMDLHLLKPDNFAYTTGTIKIFSSSNTLLYIAALPAPTLLPYNFGNNPSPLQMYYWHTDIPTTYTTSSYHYEFIVDLAVVNDCNLTGSDLAKFNVEKIGVQFDGTDVCGNSIPATTSTAVVGTLPANYCCILMPTLDASATPSPSCASPVDNGRINVRINTPGANGFTVYVTDAANVIKAYTFDPGTGSDIVNSGDVGPLAPGTYKVQVDASINLPGYLPSIQSVTIVTNPAPTASISEVTTSCTDQLTANAGGGTGSNYKYNWNDPTNSQTASVYATVAGEYDVTVTDDYGCTVGASKTPQFYALAATAVAVPVTCSLNTTGSIDVTVNGGHPHSTAPYYTYTWQPGTVLSHSTATGDQATALATNTYTVTVKDDNNCTFTTTATVDIQPITINPVASPSTPVCPGTNVTLSVTACNSCTYTWAPSSQLLASTAGSSVTVSPSVTTDYVVTVHDGSGCTNSTTITVTVKPLPTVTLPHTSETICGANGSVQLTASGNASYYEWSTSAHLTPPSGMSPSTGHTTTVTLAGGTADFTVTGTTDGCSATASVTVTEQDIPDITISQTTYVCANTNYVLKASTQQDCSSCTYSWAPANNLAASSNTGNVTVNITNDAIYNLTVNEGVCTATSSTDVRVNRVNLASTHEHICSGAAGVEISVLDHDDGLTYTWTPSTYLDVTTGYKVTASPSADGDYPYTVSTNMENSDASECTVTATCTVTVGPVVPTIDAIGCLANGHMTLIANSNDPNTCTYLWGDNSAHSTLDITSGGTYNVTVSEGTGCSGTATKTVTVGSLPTATAAGTNGTCGNSNGTVDVTVTPSGGANDYTYTWWDGIISNTSEKGNVGPGTYAVTVTDQNNCSVATNTVTIVSVNPPIAHADPGCATCDELMAAMNAYLNDNGNTLSSLSSADFGTDFNSYLTNLTGKTSINSYNTIKTTCGFIVDVYLGIVTDIRYDPVSGKPNEQICTNGDIQNSSPTVCNGSCIQIGAAVTASEGTPPYTYSWYPSGSLDDGTSANPTACPTDPTTYSLTVTDASGCTSVSKVSVSVNPLPSVPVIAPANPVICNGIPVSLDAGNQYGCCHGDMSYAWTMNGSPVGSNTQIYPAASTGNYAVVTTDQYGCSAASAAVAVTSGSGSVDITTLSGGTPPTQICEGQTVSLMSSPSTYSSYSWSTGDGTATVTFSGSTNPSIPVSLNVPYGGMLALSDGTNKFYLNGDGMFTILGNNIVHMEGLTVYYLQDITGHNVTVPAGTTAFAIHTDGKVYSTTNASVPLAATGQTVGVATFTSNTYLTVVGNVVQDNPGSPAGFSDPGAPCVNNRGFIVPTYKVILTTTAASGCAATKSVNISVYPVPGTPAITPADPVICNGINVTLDAGSDLGCYQTASHYTWATSGGTVGSDSRTYSVGTPGNYYVVVTTQNGCTANSETVTVVNGTCCPDPSETIFAAETTVCSGNGTYIDIPNSINGIRYQLYESPDNVLSDYAPFASFVLGNGGDIHVPTSSITSETYFMIHASNASGTCSTILTTVIPVAVNNIAAHAGTDVTVCYGDAVNLSGSASDGLSPYTYSWTANHPETISSVNNPTVHPTQTTIYTLTVTDASSPGCSSTANVTVTVNALPPVWGTVPSDNHCNNNDGTVGVVLLEEIGVTYNYSYHWSTGVVNTTGVLDNLAPGTYNVTVTDLNTGCSVSTFGIVSSTGPTADAGHTFEICAGPAQLGATPSGVGGTAPLTYLWKKTGVTGTYSTLANPSTTTTGTFTLVVTDAHGCSDASMVVVTQTPFIECRTEAADTLSLDSLTKEGFLIYPNPTDGKLTILHSVKNVIIDITDMSGKELLSISSSTETNTIDISNLSDGLYLCRIRTNDKSLYVQKIVLIHY